MDTDEISEWKNALTRLPDQRFFHLINLYLGKIKTPFNKQNLIEKLSSFLHKQPIRNTIVQGLDEKDILILAAVHAIPGISKTELMRLFFRRFSVTAFYEKLANLEARLLIYETQGEELAAHYKIIPFLITDLKPLLSEDVFLLPEKKAAASYKEPPVTEMTLAGLYAFCIHNEAILKTDGTLKKRALETMCGIFPALFQNGHTVYTVFAACENLSLLLRTDSGYSVQKQKWQDFAELSGIEKKAYFIAAAEFKTRKENIRALAEVVLCFISSLEENAFYRQSDLEQYLYLLCCKNFRTSVLYAEITEKISDENSAAGFITAAIDCGVLCRENSLIYVNPAREPKPENGQLQKPLLINSSFEVTVLPGSGLSGILNAAEALHPVLIQTAGKFEITKETCLNVFRNGFSDEDLCGLLAAHTEHSPPQNVSVSIREWYKNFTALSVYGGFVVSVSEEKRFFFEKDSPVKKLVRKKLADGVYLLNIGDIREFESAVGGAGLEFIFYDFKTDKASAKKSFTHLTPVRKKSVFEPGLKSGWLKAQKKRKLCYDKIADGLYVKAAEHNFSGEELAVLHTMILNKTVITETQLNNGGINLKKKEAGGIDFSGKMRIAELAVENRRNIELFVNLETGIKKIFGTALQLLKKEKNAELILITAPEKETLTVSLAHISRIKLV